MLPIEGMTTEHPYFSKGFTMVSTVTMVSASVAYPATESNEELQNFATDIDNQYLTNSTEGTLAFNPEFEEENGLQYFNQNRPFFNIQGDTDSVNYLAAPLIIGLVGVLGNSLVLHVFRKSKALDKSPSAALIMSQSAIDLAGSAFLLLQDLLVLNLIYNRKSLQNTWTCRVFVSELIVRMFSQLSTLNLEVLTVQRYVKTCHPFSNVANLSRKTVVAIMFGLGLLVTGFSTTTIMMSYGVHDGVCYTNYGGYTMALTKSYFSLIYSLILPITIFIFCYVSIFLKLRKSKADVNRFTDNNVQKNTLATKQEVNVTKTLVLVSVLYLLCWAPINILALIGRISPGIAYKMYKYFVIAGDLTLANNIVNFFVYTLKHQVFKKELKAMILPCRPQESATATTRSTSGMSVRSTTVSSTTY